MAEEPLNNPDSAPLAPPPAPEEPVVFPKVEAPPPPEEAVVIPEAEKPASGAVVEEEPKKVAGSVSFKEETNVVADLPDYQKKALDELKKLVQDALNNHLFTPVPPPPPQAEPETEQAATEAVVEEEKKEKKEEEKEEEKEAPPAAAAAEEEKASEEAVDESAEVVTPPPPAVADMVAAAAVVDEDGAKTVEAIEETIVSVSAPPPSAPQSEEQALEKEAEEVKQEAEPVPQEVTAPAPVVEPEEVFLYGVPLLGDERSDTILLKFLRARDFKPKEAFAMLKNTVRWRKEFGVDTLLEEDLGTEYEKVVFVHGFDKEKRPVVYNVFGEFQDKEFYQNAFSDAEKQKKFLKWLVQFLERTVKKFDFGPTGINSLVLVNDLKNSPGYGKRDLYKVTSKFFQLLQDNYPEFVAKQVCINVSWWYVAYSWVYISVFTPRSKSKFVFAGASKTAETLFKFVPLELCSISRYIAPEHVPVQYGGHSRTGELEFSHEDSVIEVDVKPNSKHEVELSHTQLPSVLVWELRVVGWDVTYEAQYVPAEGYTVLVSKPRKFAVVDDPIIADSFKITEPGKVVLSIDNKSSKKKKLLYRFKIKTPE
ncbi:Patellin-3-like protein [Drosera capensis]